MTRSRISFLLVAAWLALTLVSCKNPCEEAVKKTIACAQGEGLKSSPPRQPGVGGTDTTEPEMTAPDMPEIPD